jgi:hypothetical protein
VSDYIHLSDVLFSSTEQQQQEEKDKMKIVQHVCKVYIIDFHNSDKQPCSVFLIHFCVLSPNILVSHTSLTAHIAHTAVSSKGHYNQTHIMVLKNISGTRMRDSTVY